jgi:D-alanyl-lipoteichoic acid acyltransferase DltB (MBOAT superfamily)
MIFTDIIFPIFLGIVFVLYWIAMRKSVRWQNVLLLCASYLFYGWWDWRFLGLIALTSATTYITALLMQTRHHSRIYAVCNIVLNAGILVAFKYFNFFADNMRQLMLLCGWNVDIATLDIVLPVGISFYTLQAISYTVDVYRRQLEPCRNPIVFFTYIAYFPQLVAGPIERAGHLLPQLQEPRRWDSNRAVTGMRMILFGLAKKLCVANILGVTVDRIYSNGLHTPISVVGVGLLFAIEIYCDFSAYSEIAKGVSRLLGIELMENFRFPLFSRNVLERWQRWHISLMLWMRDYIYIPLGGNRKGRWRTYVNSCIVFLVSGFWHGAAWNFLIWGAYWALCYVGIKLLNGSKPKRPIEFGDLPSIVLTMAFVSFGDYLFRCPNWHYIAIGAYNIWAFALFFAVLWGIAKILTTSGRIRTLFVVVCLAALIYGAATHIEQWYLLIKEIWMLPMAFIFAIEWWCRNDKYPLERVPRRRWLRLALYWALFTMIVFSEPTEMTFIYFKF